MRTMPVLAKQVATLDQLSGGRVILGVGTGAYREEYEALFPDAKGARRGDDRRRGHAGAAPALHRAPGDLPRARTSASRTSSASRSRAQTPLPMYAGGNHPEVRRRAGRVRRGLDAGGALAGGDRAGRRGRPPGGGQGGARRRRRSTSRRSSPCSIGRTHDEAVKRFHASQLYKHLESLKRSTLREQTGGFEQRNLIGSPAEICERIRVYERAGVTTLLRHALRGQHGARDAGGHRAVRPRSHPQLQVRSQPWIRT